jgi:UDP-N-acetylmuramoylalanine--D-glutamate ligase
MAIVRGIPLSNDSLLTLQLARQRGLGPLVALTGSSGKTTTTTLVGQMLAAAGYKVHVGGNIGTPLIDRLDEVQPGEPVVLELSSFQLELFTPQLAWGDVAGVGPDVAGLLNLTPNHLDRHPDMAAYADAKLNLLRRTPAGAQLVLSADDAVTQRLLLPALSGEQQRLPPAWELDGLLANEQAAIAANGKTVVAFSRLHPLAEGAWLEGDTLVYNGQAICQRDEVLLRGDHNISNLLAAAAISGAAGASVAAMRQVATSFRGVRHRLEIVHSTPQATWINDSIATAPERAVAALRCFTAGEQSLILLAGGKDKNLPWEFFADEVLARVNYLIGFGHAGPMVVEKVQERAQYTKRRAPNCAVVQRLDEAVALAARVAGVPPVARAAGGNGHHNGNGSKQETLPTVVLLSPGGTSYDAYCDFEERGEHFCRLVESWMTAKSVEETPLQEVVVSAR